MNNPQVVVIGAGPSGVAAALSLRDCGICPLLIDRNHEVGSSWRRRYDRLKLNTGRQFSHLPGRKYPKGTPIFPTRDNVVDHLDRHAHEDRIKLKLGTAVTRIDRGAQGWRVQTSSDDIDARQVIVATGYEHTPVVPKWPGMATFQGKLLHSSEYRNAAPYRDKRVLVVGGGSSGLEIVHDVAAGGAAKSWLSIRTPPTIMPRRGPAGLPSDFIATLLYHIPPRVADVIGEWGRRIMFGDLVEYGLPAPREGAFTLARIGRAPAIVDKEVIDSIRSRAIEVVPDVTAFHESGVSLMDGAQIRPDVVICATGYRRGLEPLVGHLGVLDERGVPVAVGETPAAEGLRFIGFLSRPALIGHVAKQSRRVAQCVAAELERSPGYFVDRPRRLLMGSVPGMADAVLDRLGAGRWLRPQYAARFPTPGRGGGI